MVRQPTRCDKQGCRRSETAAQRDDDEIDAETALDFLAAHQPMPADADLTDDVIGEFERVRKYFVVHPDPRCLSLFLRAVPSGSSGFGVYQLLDDVLNAHAVNDVVAALDEALSSTDTAHEWMIDLALDFDDPRLLAHAKRLSLSRENDVRELAAAYLATYDR